jgi:hypothetical protein
MASYFANSRVMLKGKNNLAEFNSPTFDNGYGYLHVGKKLLEFQVGINM